MDDLIITVGCDGMRVALPRTAWEMFAGNEKECDMSESSLLNEINKHGKFTREQRRQLSSIKTYFGYFMKMKRQNPNADYSKYFLTFAYNLWTLGLEPAAHIMLDQINPAFYTTSLLKEMQRAQSFLIEGQQLVGKTDTSSIQRLHVCNTEGEFFYVALNMIGYLMELKDFHGRAEFLQFVNEFDPEGLNPVV
jgi:hypothetical protein